MARPDGSVPIMLDRQRTLKGDLNALCSVEEATGRSVFSEGEYMRLMTTFSGQRALLWAFLRHEDPRLTLEQVGDLLAEEYRQERYKELAAALSEAWEAGFPVPVKREQEEEGGSQDEGPLQERAPGSSSGLQVVSN